jgi:hypothetical protein
MKTVKLLQLVKEIANHEYDKNLRPSENYNLLKEMAQKIVIENIEEDFITNKDESYNWLFNWEGGGFNDVWARTKEEAIEKVNQERIEIKKKYPTNKGLKAIPSSFRKATRKTSDAQNRAGWMMSI